MSLEHFDQTIYGEFGNFDQRDKSENYIVINVVHVLMQENKLYLFLFYLENLGRQKSFSEFSPKQ